jgi:hypothetical protein
MVGYYGVLIKIEGTCAMESMHVFIISFFVCSKGSLADGMAQRVLSVSAGTPLHPTSVDSLWQRVHVKAGQV